LIVEFWLALGLLPFILTLTIITLTAPINDAGFSGGLVSDGWSQQWHAKPPGMGSRTRSRSGRRAVAPATLAHPAGRAADGPRARSLADLGQDAGAIHRLADRPLEPGGSQDLFRGSRGDRQADLRSRAAAPGAPLSGPALKPAFKAGLSARARVLALE